ncbi:SGNH/GDSL hydrolase family protein [Priestia megaterium]|nr:SGNH/GDSL hydrolase family protein [Priestia megaterium]
MKNWKKTMTLGICIVVLTSCSAPTFLMKNQEENVYEKQVELAAKDQIPKGFFPVDLDVVAIGDSLTEGVGDETKEGGYVPFIEKYISEQNEVDDVQITNLGKRGNRTDQLLARLNQDSIAEKVSRADMIYLTIGGNDVMKVVRDYFYNISIKTFKTEQVKYEKRLNQVFQRIRQLNPDAHIYLVGFYNPFFKTLSDVKEINVVIDEWNEASKKIALKYDNVTYVKVDDIFYKSEDNLFGKDEFHPNQKGYKLMAERIRQSMQKEDPLLGKKGEMNQKGEEIKNNKAKGNE